MRCATLAGSGDQTIMANATPFAERGVPALGGSTVVPVRSRSPAEPDGAGFILENPALRVVVDDRGLIVSMQDRRVDREIIPAGAAGNLLQLHRDTPARWDAWDIEEQYRRTRVDLTEVESITTARRAGDHPPLRPVADRADARA